jgi:hypothetical protein
MDRGESESDEEGPMTYGRGLAVLTVAAAFAAGCAGSELKARKDSAWSWVPQSLPDTTVLQVREAPLKIFSRDIASPLPREFDASTNGYGHVYRWFGFLVYPVGVVLDYAISQPLYVLAGLAPEWSGLTADDGHVFHLHHPELTVPRDAPRRFE